MTVLDMFELLHHDASQLLQLTCDTEFTGSRGLALDWASTGGSELVKAATSPDVSLMLHLILCRQVGLQYESCRSNVAGHVNACYDDVVSEEIGLSGFPERIDHVHRSLR